jgi:RNA recognition motif-containing protein
MAKRLFVGGIAWATTNEALQAAFEQVGVVEYARIATDRMTGRSRGFGFVEMATDEEAQKAIALWDGKELDGRVLKVNEAMPREERE